MSLTAWKSLQTGLRGLGHDPGPIDGRNGPRTTGAVLALAAMLQAGPAPVPAPPTPEPQPPAGAMIYQGTARYPVREIIIHAAATRPDWMAGRPLAEKRAEIRRWHTDPVSKGGRGWSDIGYHWLIDRDGKVAPGRAETTVGAHVAGRNAGTIGVCLIGGFGAATDDRFAENFTAAQDTALRRLIREISGRTRIAAISGHNQYANKACPGFRVDAWLKEA